MTEIGRVNDAPDDLLRDRTRRRIKVRAQDLESVLAARGLDDERHHFIGAFARGRLLVSDLADDERKSSSRLSLPSAHTSPECRFSGRNVQPLTLRVSLRAELRKRG